MEILSLGLYKFRLASTGTDVIFSILRIFFKFYGQNSKIVSISIWEILSIFWLKL